MRKDQNEKDKNCQKINWQVSLPGMTEKIQKIISRVIQISHPIKIIIFGSFARGDEDAKSDVDILIVKMQIQDRSREQVELRRSLRGSPYALDLFLVSDEEYRDAIKIPGTVIYWANKEGVVVYERA